MRQSIPNRASAAALSAVMVLPRAQARPQTALLARVPECTAPPGTAGSRTVRAAAVYSLTFREGCPGEARTLRQAAHMKYSGDIWQARWRYRTPRSQAAMGTNFGSV